MEDKLTKFMESHYEVLRYTSCGVYYYNDEGLLIYSINKTIVEKFNEYMKSRTRIMNTIQCYEHSFETAIDNYDEQAMLHCMLMLSEELYCIKKEGYPIEMTKNVRRLERLLRQYDETFRELF